MDSTTLNRVKIASALGNSSAKILVGTVELETRSHGELIEAGLSALSPAEIVEFAGAASARALDGWSMVFLGDSLLADLHKQALTSRTQADASATEDELHVRVQRRIAKIRRDSHRDEQRDMAAYAASAISNFASLMKVYKDRVSVDGLEDLKLYAVGACDLSILGRPRGDEALEQRWQLNLLSAILMRPVLG